jgi:hypothetical protein
MATTLTNKAIILAELWLDYRNEEDFEDFVKYNDLGLPLAYALSNGIIEPTEKATGFIEEAFQLLLAGVSNELLEDTGFTSLEELLDTAMDK